MKKIGKVVYLKTPIEELWNRIQNDKKRPLLQTENPKQTVYSLMEKRSLLYEESPYLTETKDSNPHQVISIILQSI